MRKTTYQKLASGFLRWPSSLGEGTFPKRARRSWRYTWRGGSSGSASKVKRTRPFSEDIKVYLNPRRRRRLPPRDRWGRFRKRKRR